MTSLLKVIVAVWALALLACEANILGEPEATDCKADFVFLLDSSSSFTNIFSQAKQFITELAKNMKIEQGQHRCAILQFSSKVKQVKQYNFDNFTSTSEFLKKVNSLSHMAGTTYTGRALKYAKEILKDRRTTVPTILVTVTDGFAWDKTDKIIREIARMDGVVMYAVSVFKYYHEKELLKLANGDRERMFTEPHAMHNAQRALQPYICGPLIQPIVLADPGLCQVDLLLAIDGSGRTGDLFDRYRMLAIHLLESLEVGREKTRVALSVFSNRVQQLSSLKETDEGGERLIEKIRNAHFLAGNTDLPKFIGYAVGSQFTTRRGDRPTAENAVVVFTNGYSCSNSKRFQKLKRKSTKLGAKLYFIVADENGAFYDWKELQNLSENHVFYKESEFPRFLETFKRDHC